jgi:hypothetical protein
MKYLKKQIDKIPYLKEKKRFITFSIGLFAILLLSTYLFQVAYSRYEVRTKLMANIDKALYLFKSETVSFNLDSSGIIPRDQSYQYRFSVSNFTTDASSDVDLTYNVKVRTTTNLPLQISMYRNQLPEDNDAVDIFSGSTNIQDEDSAWYHLYDAESNYEMLYETRKTDVYTMVITFPAQYANNEIYANYIESIEVILESKQMVQEEL